MKGRLGPMCLSDIAKWDDELVSVFGGGPRATVGAVHSAWGMLIFRLRRI